MDPLFPKELLQRLLTRRNRGDGRLEPGGWTIAKAVNEATGMVGILRIRTRRPDRSDIDSLSTAIVIKWSYESPDGLPPTDVNERQLQFERALDPLSESDHSELVQVFTGMGLKEWTFYAHSQERFMAHLNELLSGHPAYPLQIEIGDDPGWQIWGDFLKSIPR